MMMSTERILPETDPRVDGFLRIQENYRSLYARFKTAEPQQQTAISTIQTHCARLYLGTDFVVKIKRPVSYSYLDLSSVYKRRKMCEKELEINRPGLPDVYLCTAAIVETGDGTLSFALDSAGYLNGDQVLEWCLVMRKFDESSVLDNVAQRGEFDSSLAALTGKSIAEYHNSLEPFVCNDGDTRVDELMSEIEFELKLLTNFFSKESVDRLIEAMYARFRVVKSQLISRSRDGFVCRGHGDLHLRNMLLRNRVPVPFDALEFDERLATTDVLYDLAFLIMDLCHRDLVPEANTVLNEYLLQTNEQNVAGVNLLDLFISIRASIRAMTTAQSASALKGNAQRVSEIKREAQSYFALAEWVLSPKAPIVVAVGGFSGSGKSTVSKALAGRLCSLPGAVLLQSDAERKQEFKVAGTHRLPDEHYTLENANRVYHRLFDKAKSAASNGYPLIIDATFLSQARRESVEKLAVNANVPFFGFWLIAPVDVMQKRVLARKQDTSDADVTVLDRQLKNDKGVISWQLLDTDCNSDEVVANIMEEVLKIANVQTGSSQTVERA